MSWFEKLIPSRPRREGGKGNVPEGLWVKCDACGNVLYRAELERNQDVCPKCENHMRIGARMRLQRFLDEGPREELGENIEPVAITLAVLELEHVNRLDILSQLLARPLIQKAL